MIFWSRFQWTRNLYHHSLWRWTRVNAQKAVEPGYTDGIPCTNKCNCAETCEKTEISDDEVDVWDDCNGHLSDSTYEEDYEFKFNDNEKVAPVPLFTDNFLWIFTIRRYHPRCENLTWFCRVSNAVLDDWPLFLFMSPRTEKFYDEKRPFLDFLKKSRNLLIKTHYKIHKEGVSLKSLAGVAVSILKLLIFLKFTQTIPFL